MFRYKMRIVCILRGVIWGGLGGRRPPPQGKRKKEKKKEKKEKKRKKRKKERKKERKRGTMKNVKLLHMKCCFFQFFNSQMALKNKKKFWPPKKKLKWRYCAYLPSPLMPDAPLARQWARRLSIGSVAVRFFSSYFFIKSLFNRFVAAILYQN